MAQTYIIEGVEALWPKVDQTYAFDQMKNRSMPCGPRDPNAEFSIQFRMDAPAAKALFKVMKDTYAANREDNWSEKLVNPFVKDDDGTYTHKAVLKGAYGGQVTIAPVQYDSQGNELPKDFLLTTGSTVNVCVQMVPYNFGGKQAVSVSATGISHTNLSIEDISYITLHFSDKTIVHITSSWISPVKIRSTLIGGTKKMVIYDDVEPTEKIKIYDSGFSVQDPEEMHKFLVDYRFGDIHIPKIAQTEALLGVANDFISAIENGTIPISNAQTGLRVVAILEAAEKSMKQKGAVISLK